MSQLAPNSAHRRQARLIQVAGGENNIVTEDHIHTRRAAALRSDTQALTAARRDAGELDDRLTRAETIAAHAFAKSPAHSYDLAAEIPQLRSEIELLEAASTCSPAAIYHPPEPAVRDLDQTHRRVVAPATAGCRARC